MRAPGPAVRALLLATILGCGAAFAVAREGSDEGIPPGGGSGGWSAKDAIVLEIEGWWAAPRDLDLDYAFIDPSGSLSGGGELQTLSAGRQETSRIRVAWKAGLEGSPTAGAAFWRFDTSASDATGEHAMNVGALLASPDFAISRSLVDFACSRTRVRGVLVDADLSWQHPAGAQALIGFSAGLRLFRFEQETEITYGAERAGVILREFIRNRTEARGVGPRGALVFGYRLGRHVLIGGEMGAALPVGEMEGRVTDAAFMDGSFDRSTVADRPGARHAYPQLDGSVRVEIRITRVLTASAAYRYSVWRGVALTDRFVDDISQNSAVTIDGDVVFEGPAVALRFEF